MVRIWVWLNESTGSSRVCERIPKFVSGDVTPSVEAYVVNAGESSVTYIGRKWDGAVGGRDTDDARSE